MTTIKTPIEALCEVYQCEKEDLYIELALNADIHRICRAIEAYHNQFDCIDKQTIKDAESKSKELEKWIDENPSEFKRIVDEVDAMGFEGPTVDEYFNSLGGGFTAQEMISFAQHLLKDYSTIEVTQETLNNFLNKK